MSAGSAKSSIKQAFLVRDSPLLFGGLYGGIGLFLILAASNLRRHQSALNLVFVLTFIGCLARFTMLRLDITFVPGMLPSLFVELVLMPIFVTWLAWSVRAPRQASRTCSATSPAGGSELIASLHH